MTTIEEEDQYWADQIEGLHHDALTNVRASATKWQAAITALLGTFVTVTFIWGPEKLEKYPIGPGFWRDLSLILLVGAGIAGLAAIVLASLAAIGVPRQYSAMTGPELEDWTQARAGVAASYLRGAMRASAGAGVLAVLVSGWVLVAAATKAPPPTELNAIVSSRFGHVCGELKQDGASLALKVGDRSWRIPARSHIKIVESCPS